MNNERQLVNAFFVPSTPLPEGLRVKVADRALLTEAGRQATKGNILDVDLARKYEGKHQPRQRNIT